MISVRNWANTVKFATGREAECFAIDVYKTAAKENPIRPNSSKQSF